MTEYEKQEIARLYQNNISYRGISQKLNIPINTVKSTIRRFGFTRAEGVCKQCNAPLKKAKNNKIFCSDKCRMQWWNSHPELIIRKAYYHFICAYCGREFDSYGNAHRKYCCHKCYTESRKKEVT